MEDEKVVKIDTSLALANIDKLNKSLDGVDTKLNNISNNVKQAGTNISTGFTTAGKALETFKASSGAVGQATSALLTTLTGVNGTLKGLTSALPFLNQGLTGAASGFAGMTAQALAFIATPVGAVVAAIALALKLLADAFKRNEDAMVALKKLMAPFQALWQSLLRIFDSIVSVLTDVINKFTDGSNKINIFSFGIKQLEVTLGILSAAFKILERNVKFVFDSISKLGTAFKSFIDKTPIKGFVEDLAAGFAKVKEAVSGLVNTIANSGLGKALGWDIVAEEIKNSVNGTDELIEKNKIIAEQEGAIAKIKRANTVEISKNEQMIADLRAKAADKETYSAKERIKFLEDASNLELANLEKVKNLRQAELDLIKQKNLLTSTGVEGKQAEADAQAALNRATTDYLNLQRALNKALSNARKEAKKDAADLAAATNDRLQKQLDKEIVINKRIIEDEQKRLDKEIDIEKQRLKLYKEGTLEYEQLRLKIKELEDKYDDLTLQKQNENYDIQIEQNKRLLKAEQDRLELEIIIETARLSFYEQGTLAYEQQLNKIEELEARQKQLILDKDKEIYDARQALFEEFNKDDELSELEQLEIEEDAKLALLEDSLKSQYITKAEYDDLETKLKEDGAKKRTEIAKREAAAQIQNTLTAANGIADILNSIASMQDENDKEGFERSKNLQIAASTINMLTGITAAISGLFTTKSGPWDIALAAILAATIAASGIANIVKIKNTKFDANNSSSASASVPSASAISASVIQPAQYEQAVDNAQLETKIGDTRVYVTEEDITNTQKRVNVQEQENTY